MKPRDLVTAVVVFLTVAMTAAGESRASKGHTDGTFMGIEQGDYAYFLLQPGKGEQESYFILRPDKSVQPYLDNPSKFKGRKVRLFWEERNENIPEAGGKQLVKVATRVEERK